MLKLELDTERALYITNTVKYGSSLVREKPIILQQEKWVNEL